MLNEQRKSRRKPIQHIGWIATPKDGVLQKCLLSDVSETGARIDVQGNNQLPDAFTLLLTRNAKTRRICHVIWRDGTYVGVRFDHPYR